MRSKLTAGRVRFAPRYPNPKNAFGTLKQGPVGRNPIHGNSGGISFAYLTSITYPQLAAANGSTLPQLTKSFAYNYASGQLAESLDENSEPTNYSYNDPFLRLTDRKSVV